MRFVNPQNLVAQLNLKNGDVVADFGSGAGFFTLAAAGQVGNDGMVYAVDVQQSKLVATQSMAVQQGHSNVQTVMADLDKPFDKIQAVSCDYVIMTSVLHQVGNRAALLQNAYKILKTGGKILALEWKSEKTPFGPAMERRVPPQQLEQDFNKLGMRKLRDIGADFYHYAMLFEK